MRIEFSPEFSKYVGFLEYVEITGKKTVGDTIQELFARFPSLLMFLVDKEYTESKKTSLKLNGEYIFEFDDLHILVNDSDVLEFGRDVPEGEGAAGKIIAGAVLMVAGVIFEQPYLIAMGASLAFGGVADLIIGQPKLPSFASDGGSDSPSYSFGQIPNTTASGTPVGIVYGRHRIGGHLLNVYTDVRDKSNFLHAQLGLCEGPIKDIKAEYLEINGKNVAQYNDVVVHRRLGTSLQEYDKPVYSTEVDSGIVPTTFNVPYPVIPADPAYYSIADVGAYAGIELKFKFTYTNNEGLWYDSYLEKIKNGIELLVVYTNASTGTVTSEIKYFTSADFVAYEGTQYIITQAATKQLLFTGVGEYSIRVALLTDSFSIPFETDSGTSTVSIGVAAALTGYLYINTVDSYSDKTGAMYMFTDTRNTVANTPVVIPYDDSPDVGIPTGTVVTTSRAVNTVDLIINAPAFYYTGTSVPFDFATVTYRIYCKKASQADTAYVQYPVGAPVVYTFKEKSKSEVFNNVLINFATLDTYDIMVVRTTPRHNTSVGENWRYQDEIYVKSITEIVDGEFIYPWTALMGVHIKANDQLQGSMPTITSVIEGMVIAVPDVLNYSESSGLRSYSGVWDGVTWKSEWSNDPIWCLWDLLTNTRYGLGDYFKIDAGKLSLILGQLYVLSQHCADPLTYTAGGVESTQNRYSLDLVIDTSKSAIEWINTICAAMNAFVCYTEGYLYIDIDRIKPMTQIFNMSNISEFKQSGGSYKEIPNVYEVQFANEKDHKYEMDVFRLEASELQTDSTIEERKKTLNLIGVTNIQRCARIATKLLLQGQRATTTVSFKTGTHALQSMIGDIVGIQHDVPQWGFDGTVQDYNSTTKVLTLSEYELFGSNASYSVIFSQGGRITNSVTVVKPPAWALGVSLVYNTVYLHNGKLYKAKSTHTSTVNDEPEVGVDWETKWRPNYTVTLTANPTFDDNSAACTPVKGDICVIGTTSYEVKPFRLVNIIRDPDEQISLTCIEYVESVYTDSDSMDGLYVTPTNYYTELPLSKYQSVENFVAESVIYTSSSGAMITGIDCWYTVPVGYTLWDSVVIKYGLAGSGSYETMPVNSTGYVRIPSIDIAGTYIVVACSNYKDGTKQSTEAALADAIAMPYATVVVTFEIANSAFLAGITGLRIAGAAPNVTEFTGRNCPFEWNRRLSTDYVSGVVGADATANDDWFSHYEVRILGIDDTLRRTAITSDESYIYTHDDNHLDGITRFFKISVIIHDRLGRFSAPVSLIVSNPTPAMLS